MLLLEEEVQFGTGVFFLFRAVTVRILCTEGLPYGEDDILGKSIVKAYTPALHAVFIAEIAAVAPVGRAAVVGAFVRMNVINPCVPAALFFGNGFTVLEFGTPEVAVLIGGSFFVLAYALVIAHEIPFFTELEGCVAAQDMVQIGQIRLCIAELVVVNAGAEFIHMPSRDT